MEKYIKKRTTPENKAIKKLKEENTLLKIKLSYYLSGFNWENRNSAMVDCLKFAVTWKDKYIAMRFLIEECGLYNQVFDYYQEDDDVIDWLKFKFPDKFENLKLEA